MPLERLNKPESEQSNPSRAAGKAATSAAGQESLAMQLAQHRITSVPITFFDWGGYRYSNASDAIAAAKRGARK